MLSGTLLRAGLDHAVVAARGINHPAAFPDEQRDWLFHVDVFSGGARQHRHQRVPVIRSADDNSLQILVLEHLPEVGIRLRGLTARGHPLLKTRLVNIAHGGEIHIRLIFEIMNVLPAD